jgi:hypothetical protein
VRGGLGGGVTRRYALPGCQSGAKCVVFCGYFFKILQKVFVFKVVLRGISFTTLSSTILFCYLPGVSLLSFYSFIDVFFNCIHERVLQQKESNKESAAQTQNAPHDFGVARRC